MTLSKIGLNMSGIDNIQPPTFNLSNTSQGFLDDIPVKANEISKGWLGLTTLIALFTFLIWKLGQDLADGGDYGYEPSRAVCVASAVCSIVGLYALNLGYFVNFFHVALFIIISFISVGVIYKSGN